MSPLHAALAVASAAVAATYLTLGRDVRYSRRLLYALLRAGALALVAFVLIAPERATETEVVRRRTLALLLDNSRSMALPVSPGSARSRVAKMEEMLGQGRAQLEALRSRCDLAVYEFDREARRMEGEGGTPAIRAPDGTGEATALGEALVQVLDEHRGGRLSGIVVISDGASNLGITDGEAARACAAARTPVHAIAVGEGGDLADLSVESLEAPSAARVGVPVPISTRVRARGIRRQTAALTISGNPDGRGWKVVARRKVSLAGDAQIIEMGASFTPRSAGTLAIEAEVSAPAEARRRGEPVTANNRRMTFVDVEESSLRVLYIEGVLRLDFRTLRRALGAAEDFEVDLVRAFAFKRAGRSEATDGVRPAEHDVFVVGELGGEVNPGAPLYSFLGEVDRLVREGGRGLVVFSGPQALARLGRHGGPLARSLPVKVTDAGPSGPKRVRPTAEGRSHPALRMVEQGFDAAGVWSGLGPLGDLPGAAGVKHTGEALLVAGGGLRRESSGPPSPRASPPLTPNATAGHSVASAKEGGVPVLVAGRAGSGRVAVFLSGKTHVWKDAPRAPKGAYERLARSLVAWAAGRESSNAILSVDMPRHRLYVGDEVTLTARINRARAREAGLSDAETDRIEITASVEGPLGDPKRRGSDEDDAPAKVLRLRRRGDACTGTVRAREHGIFRIVARPAGRDARLAPSETTFVVEADGRELETLAAAPETLKGLAEATGGLFATAEDADTVMRPLLRMPAETAVLARRRESLWDKAWVGALFLGCLLSEWWMRRR